MVKEKNVKAYNRDTKAMGGYVYTKNQRLSSIIANNHQTEITLRLVKIDGKSVIDVGCGDGTYTQEWRKYGKPKSIFAFDPSKEGIKTAIKYNKYKNVTYKVGDIYKLSKGKIYDVAIVRGVLHHLYEPEKAMMELSEIAKTVILIEPNGYNLILKVIEKTSKYHIEHEEKSYPPYLIDKWIARYGGVISKRKYAAIVPFFCPDWMANFLKKIEPYVEKNRFISWFFCSNYYVVYKNHFKAE